MGKGAQVSGKPIEYYIAMASAMVVVALQHKEKPWVVRTCIAGASGGLGYAMAAEAASPFPWMGETMAIVLITAFSYAVIDAGLAILADRQAIVAAARKWLGVGK